MTIFDFSDFREFIKFRVTSQLYNSAGRKKTNLTQLAEKLGYASPSLLSMIIRGRRIPSPELTESLLKSWNLPLKEGEYFRLMIQVERNKKKGSDSTELLTRMARLAGKEATAVQLLDFSVIRDWYYVVIRQMVEMPSFNEDPTWISKTLGRKITPSQAQQALEKLERLQLIERNPETQRLQPTARIAESTHDIPSSAIRAHQSAMIQRALEALEEKPIEERLFNTLTLNIDRARLPQFRQMLLDFMRSMNTEFSATNSDSVCQLNLQFFEHTQAPKTSQGDLP